MKEGLIPFNTARRATLPKTQQKQVNYFLPNEIEAIREALEQEPLKWKTLTHLLLISGARRGEILASNSTIWFVPAALAEPQQGARWVRNSIFLEPRSCAPWWTTSPLTSSFPG